MKQELSLHTVDPNNAGKLVLAEELIEPLSKQIEIIVPFEPERSSYPEYFREFLHNHLVRYRKHNVLVLPGGTTLAGDLELDFDAEWIAAKRLAGLACDGDLTISGDLFNRNLSFGPLFFVRGDLRVHNLIKAGAPMMVLGNVHASGIVIGEYNDGVLRIAGNLETQAYFLFDHDGYVRNKVEGASFSSDDDDGRWREILVDDVFENDREDAPDVNRLWKLSRCGMTVLCGEGQ
ncbi:MAG: hypothetical protein K2X93_00395 [Candidatus Obscuribacterales bacterium]|nr:hypothetical protein [Candidatus Obscuribacterales bacterium]